jgi:hypothetical protein
MAAKLHFAENALALHFLLKRFEGLIDIVVADENLHGRSCVGEGCASMTMAISRKTTEARRLGERRAYLLVP